MVLAGGAKGVILQHAPAREFFDELVEIIKNKVRSGGAP
jgi:hypothetical protein